MNIQKLIMRSEMITLLKWLNTLPKAIVRTRPQLGIFHAWTLILNGQVAEAEQSLQDASVDEADPVILGQVAAIGGFMALFQGNIRRTHELTQQAQALLPTGDPYL